MTKLTPTDIARYIAYIRINFENAYKTNSTEEQTILIKGWFNSLSKYPKEIVDTAVNKAVENSEFAPRLATIIKEIEKMQTVYEKTDTELWAELTGVLYEVSSCAYKFRFNFVEDNGKTQGENARIRVEEIFEELSPVLKDYCRNSGGLVEIATCDGLNYEKGRFMRVIPEIKARAKTRQSMPNGLENLIKGLSANLTLECAKTNKKELPL